MTSIHRNLLVTLLTAMTIVIVISALATYRQVRQETDEIFDYHLRQLALMGFFEFRVAYAACALNFLKSSLPAMRNITVLMVLKLV